MLDDAHTQIGMYMYVYVYTRIIDIHTLVGSALSDCEAQ